MITLRNESQWLVDKVVLTEVTWKQLVDSETE